MEPMNIIYSNDPFIGRLLSKSITPPPTAASLKKHLCRVEGFENATSLDLYLSLSEKAPVEDSTRLSLRGSTGPGSYELDPVAFVLTSTAVERRLGSLNYQVDSNPLNEWPHDQRYVYYRVFDEGGEIFSKTSFNETETSLGRIDILSIPPPYTVASLKSRIIRDENIAGRDFKLFQDDSGDTILSDADTMTLLADNYPGSRKDEPIAIVYEPLGQTSPESHPPGFSKKLKAHQASAMGDSDPTWHVNFAGEIFQTDGIVRCKPYYMESWKRDCYEAINSAGKKAFIYEGCVTLC